MTKFEHPFAKVYRVVLKEKYPDKEAAIPEGASLAADGVLKDVAAEALQRYYADKKLVVGPRLHARPADTAPKQKPKRTITCV
jgi:hypothetical protein